MTKELPKDPDERQRRTLWTVLLLNATIAIGFLRQVHWATPVR